MKNGTGYLARWALAAIPGIGLLLLAVSGPALAGVNRQDFPRTLRRLVSRL